MLELLIGVLIFGTCLYILLKDTKFMLTLLLLLSVLLHKELFSLYTWDLLPIRFAMAALVLYNVLLFAKYLVNACKSRTLTLMVLKYAKDPFIVVILLLWLVRGISIIFSADLDSSLELFAFFSSVVVAVLFIYSTLQNSKEEALRYIKLYILVGLLLTGVGFLQLILNYKFGIVFGALWTIPGHMPRVGSLFWDVNHFGGFLASLLPVIGVLTLVSPTLKGKLYYALSTIPFVSILLLTNSRTSWMLVAVSMAVFLFLILVKKFALKGTFIALSIFTLISISSIYMYSLGHSRFRDVVKTYINYRIDSFDAHFLLLQGTLDVFRMYPILGGGYGSFFEQFKKTETASEYLRRDPAGLITKVPAHSIWGEVAAETGAVGSGLWLFLVLIILAPPLYNFLRLENYKDYLLHGAIVSSILGFLTAGIFYSYNSEFFWFVLVLYFSYSVAILKVNLNMNFDFSVLYRCLQYIEHKLNAGFIALLLLSLVLIFINLGKNSLITWDESIYALISKNMVQSKEYLTLYWEKIWFEKPPLYFWITALFMQIFGVNEFAARLLSAISGFGIVLTTVLFTKRYFGKNSAYVAGFILLTTTQFLYYSRTAMLDVTATLFITLALVIYYFGSKKILNLILTGILIGLAGMTKGVIFVLPFAVICTYEVIRGLISEDSIKEITFSFLRILGVVVPFILLILMPWHLYMYQTHGKAFIDSYFFYHILERASTSIEDKGKPIYWYLIVLKVSMRIWFLLLIPSLLLAVSAVIKPTLLERINIRITRRERDTILYLLVWLIVPFAFFSLSVSKLIWYIMPVYVPLAIVCGVAFVYITHSLFSLKVITGLKDFGYISSFILVVVGLSYFYTQKDLVYTGDLNASQKEIIVAANKQYPNTVVWIDRLDHPIVLYYREGPFRKSEFKPIRSKLAGTQEDVFVFITNTRRFAELQLMYPTLKIDAQSSDFVLASYSNL